MTDDQIQRAYSALDLIDPPDGCRIRYRAGYSHPLLPEHDLINVHVRYDSSASILMADRAWGPVIDALRGVGMEEVSHTGQFTRSYRVANVQANR